MSSLHLQKFLIGDWHKIEAQIISPIFKDYRNGKLKIISFYAKKARGLMSRHLIENEANNFESILSFEKEGYSYSEIETSDPLKPIFVR